ncbi:MAG TPA: DNA polymerase III subunit alpha [Candidatus Acidoferrales bacterium]|nr:DNA polymerase III subunit alpha [Candidatus Acidoferrales bacterium]
MTNVFIHLHCHSHFSFLRAVPAPADLVAAAVREGMPAVALTDTGGLYGAMTFYQAAREAGVKPVVGALLPVSSPVLSGAEGPPAVEKTKPASERPAFPLLLLVADTEGYANLCRLVTRRQLDDRPIPWNLLDTHRDGLLALCAPAREPAGGESAPRLAADRLEEQWHRPARRSPALRDGGGRLACDGSEQAAIVGRLKEIFGDRFYLEAHHFPVGGQGNLRPALSLSRAFGVPLVATNNVHFLEPGEFLHHRVLNAVRTGSLVSRIAPPEIADAEAWFKPADAMRRAFADHPEALRATEEIAERIRLELKLGQLILPSFPAPAGETPFSYLWALCFRGARRRYRPPGPEVIARLTRELEVINRLGLAPYFLLVWDIVREARRRGIPAVGRGSAASSMVSYCLGISRVCPLRWDLYFERFLNEQRGDCPDIDLDLCGARRDEMLEYVYRRWGAAHVAMIGSYVTMHARLAVREVAKAFGVPPGEVNRFTSRLPHRPVREILEAIRVLPQCRALPAGEEPWRTVLAVALRLDGVPRHMGIHPCGTVIAPGPLAELAPLEMAAKGIVVTQYDMNAIEALGLVKMDLLGQRGLTTISLALANIERSAGGKIDFDAIPERDPAACAMIAAGRTMGVFQIESPGMRGLLRLMRARSLGEISVALALIRPGAAEYGAKETFLRRLRRQEPVRYPHPSLEPILKDTLGVCVYQEQVMRIAQAVGSLSLAEADLVRRATAKFADQRERDRLRAKFLKAAARLGLAGEELERVWQMVEKFAGFGFCKAHAATYADLAYRIAYLKAHYPAEFLAAMCSSGAGFYHVSAYVEEAKRWGIPVWLPSVNHSRAEYGVEPVPAAESAAAKKALRIGLMQVKGLRVETIAGIVAARDREGPYCSLGDFLRRVPAGRDELHSLIKCGAFDDVVGDGVAGDETSEGGGPPLTRPMRLWQLNLLLAARVGAKPAGPALFPGAAASPPVAPGGAIPPLPDYPREQRLAYEQEILEVTVSGHPLDLVARNGEAWSTDLDPARQRGRRVALLGWLITFRAVGTKDYRNMMFLTLEDQRGVFEAVLFPEAYQRYGGLVFETRMLRVAGRVEAPGQINCDKLEAVKT